MKRFLKAISLSIGVSLLLVVGIVGIASTPEEFGTRLSIAGLVFGVPGLLLTWLGWPLRPEPSTAPRAAAVIEPEFQPEKLPPPPPGWHVQNPTQPLPRPQSQGPGQPQIVYVPVYQDAPKPAKKKRLLCKWGCWRGFRNAA